MALNFSSHNVRLPDGTQTAPGQIVVAESGTCRAALRYLEEVFGPAPHDGDITVADVGCLEGGYAAEFARAGYDVTGIELREENYANAMGLREALLVPPNLHFIHADAWDVLGWDATEGVQYDAVFCCGLLYHMATPVAFLELLGQVTRRLLILNTHFSMENGHPENSHGDLGWCETGTQQNEGRSGHWFHETDNRWASDSGTKSFWLCKDDLIASLGEAGFNEVSERDDWRKDGQPLPWGSGGAFQDRAMFTALKRP